MFENKKAHESIFGTFGDVNIVNQLIRNYQEDYGFADILDRFERKEFVEPKPITVCKTPNVLALGGADLTLDMVINKNTIIKCLSRPEHWEHGHFLEKNVFKHLIFELRNPVMVLKGSKENSLVVVTDLKDRYENPVIVSVGLNHNEERHKVNRITSAYGKRDFDFYLNRQFEKNNIIAVNKNKANHLLQSLAPNCAIEETLISFDNSIAYTLENVKGFESEKPKKHKLFFQRRLKRQAKDFEVVLDRLNFELNRVLYSGKDVVEKLKFFDYAGEEIKNSLLWQQFQQDKDYINTSDAVKSLQEVIDGAGRAAKELYENNKTKADKTNSDIEQTK